MTDGTPRVTTAAEAAALFGKAQELATSEQVESAFEPYLQAAVAGLPPAAFMVSQFYYGGIGVREDAESALVWGLYSAEMNFVPAEEWVLEAYPDDFPTDSELLEIFKRKADEGCPAAMYLAGKFYRDGYAGMPEPEKAVEMFAAGAAVGSPECEAQLADCIIRGCGTPRDVEKGLQMLKDLSDKGFIPGIIGYAQCLERGIGGQRDREGAFELYTKGAEAGCSLAKANVGRCYLDGIGVESDIKKAATWCQMSADAGDAYGMFGLGRCALAGALGRGKVRDGLELLEQAFDEGCSDAGVMLAQIYAKGGKVAEKDLVKSAEWFEKAADRGNMNAILAIARIYSDGVGVKKDPAKAARYYLIAGLRGDIESLYEAGNNYLTGNGVKKDEAEGFRMLSLASDAGFMKAAYLVANCYANGKGVKRDRKKAFEAHLALAEAGYIRSMLFVGECLYNGDSVKRDVDAAVQWFKKGAEGKNVFCMYWLGDAYDRGYGVEKDPEKAVEYYKMAAEKGHVLSKRILNERQAVESPFEGFLKMADAGDAQSMYMVGMCYESGVRVEKDIAKAREWYDKAAAKGNQAAIRALETLQ